MVRPVRKTVSPQTIVDLTIETMEQSFNDDLINIPASEVRYGDDIVEWRRDGKRKYNNVIKRRRHDLCRKVHVEITGNQTWCYEPAATVWVRRHG